MKKLLFSILFTSALTFAYSQQVITAKILDGGDNSAVSDAVITLQGDTARFYSNKLGFFQLNADTTDFLIISHDRYETGKIKVPARSSFAIQLNPLNESKVSRVANEYEKGRIVNDHKTGIWEYYDIGELVMKIDYDRNEIVYLAPDSSKYAVEINDRFVMKEVDRQPRYIGSDSEVYRAIGSIIEYPFKARSKGIEGTLNVVFTIGVDGQMQDFQVINNIGGDCGESAIAAMKQIPGTWVPALVDGKPHPARFVLPFRFVLEGSSPEEPIKENNDLMMTATYLDEFVVTAIQHSR